MSGELHPDVIAAINKVAGTPLGRKYDRAMRAKYGKSGVAVAGKTVLGEFGGRSTKTGRGVVSSAGARGPAQFIPSTRAEFIQKYGVDPWKNDESAIKGLMQHQLNTGIEGYNPGMPTYKDYILGQKLGAANKDLIRNGSSGGSVTLQGPRKTEVTRPTQTIPGQSFAAERQGVKQNLFLGGGPLTMPKLLAYKQQMDQLQDVPEQTVKGPIQVKRTQGAPVKLKTSEPAPLGGGGTGSFTITGPNPKRLTSDLVKYANKVARIYGKPLTGSDGTGHSRLTVNGNVSEHSVGKATDIPLTGAALIRAGQAALIAAGMPRAKALKQTGGLFNVGNHQVIFNTQEGGDHTDHLHISSH